MLFEHTQINNMTLKNRFVRSATWEGLAERDGSCTEKMRDMMVNLAKGGVGLIITGYAYVHPSGQSGPFQSGIHKDDFIPALRELTGAVHKADGRIVMQLAHGGCHASAKLSGADPAGPSVLEIEGKPVCREMSLDEIAETVKAFADAAKRSRQAGFDGVQIHAAHGYLLSQFLSPFYNRRKDQYGGGLENRARIVFETYRMTRKAVGDDFPVLIKINSEDFLESGLAVKEMIELAGMLEMEGIDAIELSGGTLMSDKKRVPVRTGKLDSEEKEVFYREAAKRYKAKINIPLMLVGGIRSYDVAERLVSEGITDYISMSRPLIRESDLINRWKSGDHSIAECISCNSCFKPGIKGDGIYCVVKEKEMRKKE